MTKLETVIAIVRSGPDFKEYGDPYTFSCVITFESDRAHIRAAVGDFNRNTYREIKDILAEIGIKKVDWDKLNNSKRKIKKTLE